MVVVFIVAAIKRKIKNLLNFLQRGSREGSNMTSTCSPEPREFTIVHVAVKKVQHFTHTFIIAFITLHCICFFTCHSFFFFFYKFIYLFLAVLGLRFCARAFSSCGERGSVFIAVRGPLTITASHCGAQAPDAQAQ